MRIFAVFLFAYLLSQFFRSFLAVIAPELALDIGLTAKDLGNVSAAWFAAFAFAQFPVGWALDTIGPRRTVPLGMLAAVIGCVLFGAATNTGTAMAAMALIGLGCSPIYMGALYYFARTYSSRHFALLSSWLLGIGAAGNLLAATPLALASQTYGWRTTFYVIAGITLAAAALLAWQLEDPSPLKPSSDEHPTANSASDRSAIADAIELLSLRPLWPFLPIALVSYAVIAVERGLWMGPYLSEVYGLAPVDRGNVALFMAIAMSLGAIIYGPLDQWLGTRKWIVVSGTALTVAGFTALWLLPNPPLSIAITLLAIIGAAGLTYGVLMAHARAFFPDRLLGRGITMMNFLLIGGAGLLQLLSGNLVSHLKRTQLPPDDIYATLHGLFACLLLAAGLIYLFSRDSKQ